MKRKKQLVCLILSLTMLFLCLMSSVVSAAGPTFFIPDAPEDIYTLEGNTDIVPGEEFGFTGNDIELPTAVKEGYGFDGWTYYGSGAVNDADRKTKKITSAWLSNNNLSDANYVILLPVLGRTVNWHLQNKGEDSDVFSEFVPGRISMFNNNISSDFSNNELRVKEKTMSDFGDEEIKKANFKFKHWSDSADSREDAFEENSEYYYFGSDSEVESDTVDLYAVWDEYPKFDGNGGKWENSEESTSETIKYGEPSDDETYTIPDPTYKYRIFKGWYKVKYECDSIPENAERVADFKENTTYYAGWESEKYNLEYVNVLPDATNNNPLTYTKAEVEVNPINLLPAEKEGYTFEGWYSTMGNDGIIATDKVEKITATATDCDPWNLYASWSYKLKDDTITGYVGSDITPLTLKPADESLTDIIFSVKDDEPLPDGITLKDGVISGKPSRAFSGSIELNATVERTDGIDVQGPKITFNITNKTYSGGSTRYTVKFETNGADAIASQRIVKNAKVTEPATPVKDDYKFDGWYTDSEFKEKYDFSTKVTKSFTLYAKWNEESKGSGFGDVSEDDWFYNDVEYANDNDLMLGVSDETFSPNTIITRGMFVTVIYRMEGSPEVEKSIPFEDIDLNEYYADAVIWAKQNKIVKGISATEYAPDENVLREQIAAIMLRYARYKGVAPSGDWQTKLSYADAAEISDYAVPGVTYCTLNNIMQGKENNLFAPADGAKRSEIAAIIRRFIEINK